MMFCYGFIHLRTICRRKVELDSTHEMELNVSCKVVACRTKLKTVSADQRLWPLMSGHHRIRAYFGNH